MKVDKNNVQKFPNIIFFFLQVYLLHPEVQDYFTNGKLASNFRVGKKTP